MNDPKHFHDRLDAQDTHVHAAYLTAAAAHTLASKTDRDIADLQTPIRASTGVLNALRDTQIEHGQQIGKLDERVAKLDEHVGELRGDMKIVFARFEQVDARFERIDARFDRFDQRFDDISGQLAELIKRSGKTA